MSSAGGGLYRDASRLAETAELALSDREIPDRRVPFLSRLSGDVGNYGDQSRYYDRAKEVETAMKELKDARGPERVRVREAWGGIHRLDNLRKQTSATVKALNEKRDRIEANSSISAAEKDRRLKVIEERKDFLFDRFNRRYNQIVGGD